MVERNKSKVLGKRHFSAIRHRTTVQHHAPLCKVHGDTTTENYETFHRLDERPPPPRQTSRRADPSALTNRSRCRSFSHRRSNYEFISMAAATAAITSAGLAAAEQSPPRRAPRCRSESDGRDAGLAGTLGGKDRERWNECRARRYDADH